MRNLKLLLTTLLLTLVWGFSFSSAWNFDLFDNFSHNLIVSDQVVISDLKFQIYEWKTYCYTVTKDNVSPWEYVYLNYLGWNNYGSCIRSSVNMVVGSSFCFKAECDASEFQLVSDDNFLMYHVNVYEFDDSFSNSDCSSIQGQLDSCESSLSSANSSLSSCQSDLSSCQSDLSTCTNSCDTMVSQCQENLSWCNEQLTSITNYANSLDQQLQQCLANWPNQDDCEWTWCNTLLTWNWNFNIFWNDNDNMFSLPVSNNIFLPRWYRGYVDSGVVAITEIEKTKIVFDDDSKSVINQTYYVYIWWLIFIFICSLFAYYLKKFVLMFFNWKYK